MVLAGLMGLSASIWRARELQSPMLRHTIQGSRKFHSFAYKLRKGGSVSWHLALDPTISSDKSVKAFKKSLAETIQNNDWPSESSSHRGVLLELIQKFSIPNETLKKQIKKLNLLILQKRISDQDIHDAIVKTCGDKIINVVTPKPINLEEELKNISKQQDSYVSQTAAAQNLRAQQSPLYRHSKEPAVRDKKPLHTRKPNEVEAITDKDIQALKKFLERAETQENQIKKFVLQQQKKYQWNTERGPSNKISAGSLLFQEHMPTTRAGNPSYLTSKLPTAEKYLHPFTPTQNVEILVYDVAKSKENIEPSNSTILVHVQRKDLFAVVNSGKVAPDQLLEIINQFERQGWNLVGDMTQSTYKIVFKRELHSPPLIETKGKIVIGIVGVALGYVSIGKFM